MAPLAAVSTGLFPACQPARGCHARWELVRGFLLPFGDVDGVLVVVVRLLPGIAYHLTVLSL